MLRDPSDANVERLDAPLASLDARITTLLDRQVVQTPGQLPDELQSARRGSDSRTRASQPRLRAAGASAAAVRGRHLLGEGVAPASAGRSGQRNPGGDPARPAGDAPARQRARGLAGELGDDRAGDQLGLGHPLRRPARPARFVLVGLAFVGAGLLAGRGAAASVVRRFSHRTCATSPSSSTPSSPCCSCSG